MPRTWTLDVIDALLARGRTSVTTEEAAQLFNVPATQVRMRMQPLLRDGRVFSPARGLWVVIPPEYRSWRVVPGLLFIDAMMAHLSRDYYVGWLSAAELYGAAHQRPQVLQVAVDRHLPDRDIERVHLRFADRRHLAELPRVRRSVATGQVWVSAPEVTALDLAADQVRSGGVSNVATLLIELTEDGQLDADRLAEAAEHFALAAVRRLGFLLERIDQRDLAEALHSITEARRAFPRDLLAPGSAACGEVDRRWRIRVNSEIEPDL